MKYMYAKKALKKVWYFQNSFLFFASRNRAPEVFTGKYALPRLFQSPM
jgi:hypothetical protein